jgi:hypothetical protein
MAGFNLKDFRDILLETAKAIRDMKGDQADLAKVTDDLNKKFAESNKQNETAIQLAEQRQASTKKLVENIKDGNTELNNQTKRADEAEKAIAKLTKSNAALKSKLQEANKDLKQQSQELSTSFKATTKDMAAMLREAFMGGSGKGKNKDSIKNFFTSQFSGLATAITSELKNLKLNTVSIGLDIGESLQKGLAAGVKGGASKNSMGIGDLVQGSIENEIAKVQRKVNKEIKKIAADIGLETTKGLADAMKKVAEGRRETKNLLDFDIFNKWGSPENRTRYKNAFKDQMNDLKGHLKDVEKMTETHGLKLTYEQRDRNAKIQELAKQANSLTKAGMAGGSRIAGMNVAGVTNINKEIADLKEKQRVSLQHISDLATAWKKNRENEIAAALHQDKTDEMLMQQKVHRQQKLTKMISADVKTQQSEINKLTTGFADGKATGRLGKQASGMVVKTDDEAKVLKSITFITERMKELKNNEALNVKERAQLAKSYVDQFQQQTARLVALINQRMQREQEYQNWWKTEGMSGIDARVKKEADVDAMWRKLLTERDDTILKNEKRAQEQRLRAAEDFNSRHLKAEQTLQEELRRLSGRFTEKEKYTKSKKYLELSMNDQVKAEVEQAKKIETIMKAYERARSRSTRGNDMDSYYQKSADSLLAYAQKEKNVLQEMIYGRLNANKMISAEQKRNDKEKISSTANQMNEERRKNKELESLNKNRLRKQKEDEKAAASEYKRIQKEQAAAAKNFHKSWDGLFEAIGLGWRNRNVMESFQQLAHGVRRFGHDIGIMAQQVASRIVMLGATMAAFGAGVAASLAYASKQVFDFGANIVKTTEEVRGYNIALYGMMNTHSGVNDMMRVAEKVTKDMPIGFKTIQESIKGLVLIGQVRDMLKNTQDIEKVMGSLFKIVVGLSQIQPEWGAKGAIFSLRNALTGDLRSLQRRFELPVRAIYSAEGVPLQDLQYQPEKMVETLDTYISSFYSEETLKMSSNQFSAILEKIQGSWVKFISSIGEGGFYDAITGDFAKVRDFIQSFIDGKDFAKVTDQISDSMASMYTSVKNVANYVGGYIGKVFGVDDVKDIAKLSEAFRYMAAMVYQVEIGITSGAISNVFANLGDVINEKIVKPISYVKDLIIEMGGDAYRVFGKIGNAVNTLFVDTQGGIGGMLQSKTLQKGLLWTMFFGPSNVSMMLGSMALLLNSTIGLFVNMARVMVRTIAVIKDAWLLAFSVPFLKIPMMAAALVIAINSDMIAPLAKSIKGVLEALLTWFSEQMMMTWAKLAKEIPGFEKLFGAPTFRVFENEIAKKNEIARLKEQRDALLPKETIGMPQSKLKEFGNYVAQTTPAQMFMHGVSKAITPASTVLGAAIGGVPGAMLGYGGGRFLQSGFDDAMGVANQKEIERLNIEILKAEDGIIKTRPAEFFEHFAEASTDAANVLNKNITGVIGVDLGKKMNEIASGAKGFVTALFDSTDLHINMNKDLSKYAKVVHGKLADVGPLKSGAVSGASSIITQMEAMGYAPMITSAYRTDSVDHKSKLAIDLQALNKPVMNEDLLKYLGGLKEQGILKKIIAEQSPNATRFDFSSPLFKQYGIDTMTHDKAGKAVDSKGHFHLLFAENAADKLQNLSEEMKSGMEKALNEWFGFKVPEFESRFKEKAPEYDKTLLKLYSDLEENYVAVAEGMKQFTRKTTNIVTQAFEEFKDDTGHTFGPDRIRSMQAQILKTNQERQELLAEIQFSEGMSPEEAQIKMYDRLVERNQKQSTSLLNTNLARKTPMMAMPMLDPIGSLVNAGMSLQLMDSQLEIGTRQAQELSYHFERINEEASAALQNVIKFSSSRFVDSEIEKGFEFLITDLNIVNASFERTFSQKASLEALRMSLLQFSDAAVSAKDFENSLTNITQNMTLHNKSIDEAVQLELENNFLVGDKKVMLEKILDTYKKIYTEAKNTLGPIEKQRNEYAKMTNDLKKMTLEEMKRKKAEYLNSPNAAVRKSWGAEYETRISEGIESDSVGSMFANGIDIAMAEWDNFGTIVVNSGKTIANDLRQSFEDGFFDVMTGKLQGFREMFKNIGNTILQTIYKIIAQMAAISTTEIILGVNLQGGLSGGKSGGLGGVLSSVLGGGGSSSGGLVGGLVSGLLGNFGFSGIAGSANKDVVSKAMNVGTGIMGAAGGIDLTSLTSAGIAGAVAGSKGTGLLGKLTPVKEWISANALPILGVAAIGSFLSQPGRLFGGTKDKTGAAKAAYSSYTEQRNAMVDRRTSDAINYYMGGTSGLENYQFGGIGYSTWKSGDGWFKGPKEKHAATDPSAFLASMKQYYAQLMTVGQQHYSSMKEIYKKSQINQLESTKMQYNFDLKKTSLIQAEYDRFANDSYTAADKWEKMDEYRDQLFESTYSNWQTEQEIQNLQKETKYAEMEYLTYVKSNGQDTMAMAKTSIEIQKMKIAELDEYTLEWYNAKMELFQSEKDLSDSLKESAKALKTNISAGVKEIYQLGVNSVYTVHGGRSTMSGVGGLPVMGSPRAYSKIGADKNAQVYAGMLTDIDTLSGKYSASDVARLGAKATGSRDTDAYDLKEIAKYQYQDLGFFGTTFPKNSQYFDNPKYKVVSTTTPSATPVSQKITNPIKLTYHGKTYGYGDTITWDTDIIETVYEKEYITEALYSVGDLVNVTLEEAAAYIKEKLETDAENFLTNYKLDVQLIEMYGEIGDIMRGVDDSLSETFNKLKRIKVNYEGDVSLGLMSEEELGIANKELNVEIANFYTGLANGVNAWLQAGYFSVQDVAITGFADAISGGLNDIALSMYASLQDAALKMSTKGNVFSSIKDMEDFSIFNDVMKTDDMKDMRSILGLDTYEEKYSEYVPVQKTKWTPYEYNVYGVFGGTRKRTGMMQHAYTDYELQEKTRVIDPLDTLSQQYDDPYTMWFEFNKAQIEQRIANTKGKEGMEEDYYQAEYDLYTLLIDNAQKLKEKADEVNRSIEDMLGKIEETMRMRIAEEKTTTKGDIIFMDVGSTRNSQAMLDKMLAAIQTNDPKARELVEEFRKKMSGIGR